MYRLMVLGVYGVGARWKPIPNIDLSMFSQSWESARGGGWGWGRRFTPFFLLLHKDLKRMLSGVVPRLRGD